MKHHPGNKGSNGAFQHIISHLPPHTVYWELFLGEGFVASKKKRAAINVGVERDPSVIDRFRDHYPESMVVKNDCAISLLDDLKHVGRDHCIYIDAPYRKGFLAVRGDNNLYNYEMTDQDHAAMLTKLRTFRSRVVVSHYRDPLYDDLLSDWNKFEFRVMTRAGSRMEFLYYNFPPPSKLHEYTYLGMDKLDRQRIRRKISAFITKLKRLPATERNAILEALNDKV